MAQLDDRLQRDYEVYLHGPVGVNTCAFGTVAAVRSGVQHVALLSIFPEPADNGSDDFGIQEPGNFTVEIADEASEGGIDGLGPDWYLLWEDGTRIVLEDGSGCLIQEY